MMQTIDIKEIDENLFETSISSSDINLDVDKISSSLGYNLKEIPSHFSDIIEKTVKEFHGKNSIEAGFKIVNQKSDLTNKKIILQNIELNVDNIIFNQLKKAELGVLFLVTIGSEMEQWSKTMAANGDPVTAYIVDSVASSAVEELANLLHENIKIFFENKNQKITNRYSPGYCNWSVKEQKEIFSLFPDNFCSVSLTDTSLMLPVKSISGIIGVGQNVEYNEYLCDRCGVKDCTQRIYLSRKNENVKKII